MKITFLAVGFLLSIHSFVPETQGPCTPSTADRNSKYFNDYILQGSVVIRDNDFLT